jgi:hypothetical protein
MEVNVYVYMPVDTDAYYCNEPYHDMFPGIGEAWDTAEGFVKIHSDTPISGGVTLNGRNAHLLTSGGELFKLPTHCHRLFYNAGSIEGIENVDASEITTMMETFMGFQGESLDLSKWT